MNSKEYEYVLYGEEIETGALIEVTRAPFNDSGKATLEAVARSTAGRTIILRGEKNG